MDTQKKWVALIFASFSFGVWIVLKVVIEKIIVYLGILDEASWQHITLSILPMVLAIISYFLWWKIEPLRDYMYGVVSETQKVVWPTVKETNAATIGVIVFVFIIALILALFDWISGIFVGWLVH